MKTYHLKFEITAAARFCVIPSSRLASFKNITSEISRVQLVNNGTGVQGWGQEKSKFQYIWSAQMA